MCPMEVTPWAASPRFEANVRRVTDLPSAVLDAASRRGRADDMTVVALRLMRT